VEAIRNAVALHGNLRDSTLRDSVMGTDDTLLTLLMHQFPDAVHVTRIDPANKCYFFMKMADAAIDFDQRVKQRGGYDMRAVKCDLLELADPKILAKPGLKTTRWKVGSLCVAWGQCLSMVYGVCGCVCVCVCRRKTLCVGLGKQCASPGWESILTTWSARTRNTCVRSTNTSAPVREHLLVFFAGFPCCL
jgi:hypothetical protein